MYVFPITFLLPEDDTSDVIPRHTMLRHAYHLSVTRNFRLNPKEVSGPSSLASSSFVCIPASLCSASRAGETHDRAERGSKAAKRVSTPHSLRSSPASFPYSLVSRETCEDHPRRPKRERESDMRTGCPPLRCAPSRPSLAPLAAPCAGERIALTPLPPTPNSK